MKIGTVKEIKTHEYRVGLTPDCVKSYVSHGHEIYVEKNAGEGTGFSDSDYEKSGAVILNSAAEIFDKCEMIIKVKEPQPSEYSYFKKNHILYTYLHLAADEKLTRELLDKKICAIAYETIMEGRSLPCLTPMSEIAGRLAVQEGAKYLEKTFGGRGVLLGGVPGVARGKVAILGAGVVGTNACKIATGMGAEVTVLDVSSARLAYLDDVFGSRITGLYSTESNIERICRESDLIIGAVLIPGAKAPKLIKKSHLALMKKGTVLVDVAVDQGGCFETTRPTTHDNPTYIEEGIVHYCVANMPGAVALTSTYALTSTTLRYGLQIADKGAILACRENTAIAKGLNLYDGKCTYPDVASAFGLEYYSVDKIFS